MLAGANPFARESALASMNAVANDELPSLAVVRKDLPTALVKLVESLLSKTPEARPESSTKALESFLSIGLIEKHRPPDRLLPPTSHDSQKGSQGSGKSTLGNDPGPLKGNTSSWKKEGKDKNKTEQSEGEDGLPPWIKVLIAVISILFILGLMALLLRRWVS
jgi:hypothetical protein